jgi:hypothetical protein
MPTYYITSTTVPASTTTPAETSIPAATSDYWATVYSPQFKDLNVLFSKYSFSFTIKKEKVLIKNKQRLFDFYEG